MQALADHALRIAYGVAQVVSRNRFEDHAWCVGFVLSCCGGVFIEALSALKDLEILKRFSRLPFFIVNFELH